MFGLAQLRAPVRRAPVKYDRKKYGRFLGALGVTAPPGGWTCPHGGNNWQYQLNANAYCRNQGMLATIVGCMPNYQWYCDPTKPTTARSSKTPPPPGQIQYPGAGVAGGLPQGSYLAAPGQMCNQGYTQQIYGSQYYCVPGYSGVSPYGAQCPAGYSQVAPGTPGAVMYGGYYCAVTSSLNQYQSQVPQGSYQIVAGQPCQSGYSQEYIGGVYYCVPSYNVGGIGVGAVPPGAYQVGAGQPCQYGYSTEVIGSAYYCVPSQSYGTIPPGAYIAAPGQMCNPGYSNQYVGGQYYCVPSTGYSPYTSPYGVSGACTSGATMDPYGNCIPLGGVSPYGAQYSPYSPYGSAQYSPYPSYSPYGSYAPAPYYPSPYGGPELTPVDASAMDTGSDYYGDTSVEENVVNQAQAAGGGAPAIGGGGVAPAAQAVAAACAGDQSGVTQDAYGNLQVVQTVCGAQPGQSAQGGGIQSVANAELATMSGMRGMGRYIY